MHKSLIITDETKFIAYGPVRVVRIHGRNNTASPVYIQLFESPTVAASDVPAIKALTAAASEWFDWSFADSPINLSCLTVAMSSAATAYTALVNAGCDCTVEYDTNYDVDDTNTIVIGDLTTGLASREIWSNATGTANQKRLNALTVKNSSGDPLYPVIFASDAAVTTDSRALVLSPVFDGATDEFFFGDGLVPFRKDADGTQHKACVVRFSYVPTLPFNFYTDTDVYVRAVFNVAK